VHAVTSELAAQVESLVKEARETAAALAAAKSSKANAEYSGQTDDNYQRLLEKDKYITDLTQRLEESQRLWSDSKKLVEEKQQQLDRQRVE
jgi:hypothetical protein